MTQGFRPPRPTDSTVTPASFLLAGPGGGMRATGTDRLLPPGPLASLPQRTASFFDGQSGNGLLVGAVPYDRRADDHLFAPRKHHRLAPPQVAALARPALRAQTMLHPEPSPAAFREAVALGLKHIAAGHMDKLVLSRSLRLRTGDTLCPDTVLARLALDPSVFRFLTRLPASGGQDRMMVGASPELLVARHGDLVTSHPLAGSARRGADPDSDRAAGQALLQSEKDLREHHHTAQAVLDTLAPFCDQLAAPHGVALRATATMWHLGTRITGRLRDPDMPVAALLAALHPTPAVCGLPRDAADAVIPTLEGYDRGFYAGAVGWMDAQGDGEWYVTLRCAEIAGDEARLYAGAGVVDGSTPDGEEAETRAKFRTMLAALGLDEVQP
ncbi:isochorismate synthase [Paracoccus jiaweipingae]|uniref:isochorismate synthase n=1 Tax=unclassified Paracoccus (in: a-proteobacteria) TaxID=2688777 RepID=UPI0037A81C1E